MMFGYDMTAAGWFWMIGGMVALVLAIVAGAWLVARSMANGRQQPGTALDILEARLARGEISRDEFEQTKAFLRR